MIEKETAPVSVDMNNQEDKEHKHSGIQHLCADLLMICYSLCLLAVIFCVCIIYVCHYDLSAFLGYSGPECDFLFSNGKIKKYNKTSLMVQHKKHE